MRGRTGQKYYVTAISVQLKQSWTLETTTMPRGRPTRDSLHKRLEFEIHELRNRLGGLPRPVEAEDIWNEIWFQEAHNSTAIEGNTLVLREVEILLREGRAVGDKQLKDYLEVTGYADAA